MIFEILPRSVSSVFQRATTLFHLDDVLARQSTQLQLPIQVSHGNGHELFVRYVDGWWRGHVESLRGVKQQ
jgi:hypothetical protein